jgi:hypothetical protein
MLARAAGRVGVRSMSTTARVWVNKDTKVLVQGFTGKQVRGRAEERAQRAAVREGGAGGGAARELGSE